MQEYTFNGQSGSDDANLKNIFAAHKTIFTQYTNLNIPKELLKKMIKELQDYHSQLISYDGAPPIQPTS